MSHSSNHFAIAMVVLPGIMWAGSGIGAQNFFEKCSMNAMELTAFRMMAAGCILIGVTVWQGKMKESLICLRKKPRLWIDIVIYAIVGLMLMHYTYFEAIAYGNAATATVVLYSCPAMVTLLSEKSSNLSGLVYINSLCSRYFWQSWHSHDLTCQSYDEACTRGDLQVTYSNFEVCRCAEFGLVICQTVLCLSYTDRAVAKAKSFELFCLFLCKIQHLLLHHHR